MNPEIDTVSVTLPGCEWNALIKIYQGGQKLMEELDSEILRGSIREEIKRFQAAYLHYDEVRTRIQLHYGCYARGARHTEPTDPVKWLAEKGYYQGTALFALHDLCRERGWTLSRWRHKGDTGRSEAIHWAVHISPKAHKFQYQKHIIGYVQLDWLERCSKRKSDKAFEQLLEEVRASGT